MPAGSLDLEEDFRIEIAADWAIDLQFATSVLQDDGVTWVETPTDLNSIDEIVFEIKVSPADTTPIIRVSTADKGTNTSNRTVVTVTDPDTGSVRVFISRQDTKRLRAGTFKYDILLTYDEDTGDRKLEGKVVITASMSVAKD